MKTSTFLNILHYECVQIFYFANVIKIFAAFICELHKKSRCTFSVFVFFLLVGVVLYDPVNATFLWGGLWLLIVIHVHVNGFDYTAADNIWFSHAP